MPLATLQLCSDIQPIEGADKIEVATILGWKCVVKKGEFKIGDPGVFIEIDSIVPMRPEFEFLRPRHFRVSTIKLRKQISQGLFMPLTILGGHVPVVKPIPSGCSGIAGRDFMAREALHECFNLGKKLTDIVDGMDVTEMLGIIKYEKEIPAQLCGTIRGNFPTHLCPKTDETRIQSCYRIVHEILNKDLYATVKMDGCSATYIHKDGETHVCSRNNSLVADDANTFWQMERKYDILNKLKAKGNYAIQGELCGPGIQGNKMGLEELDLFIFNIFDCDKWEYLGFDTMMRYIKEWGLSPCPPAFADYLIRFAEPPSIEQLLDMAKGNYDNGDPREGIVIRPTEEMQCRTLHGRASFKVVNNDFLLKSGE
jgi:RNA ligase (TIGR02306 family)